MSVRGIYILGGFMMMILLYSCKCTNVECTGPNATIGISILKDGEDVLFGNTPLVNIENVIISSSQSDQVAFTIANEAISLYAKDNVNYQIILGDLGVIDFIVNLEITDDDGCCDTYAVMNVIQGGMVRCGAGCENVFLNL